MEKTDIVIIGAGVIGLSIAAELADGSTGIFVLEKEQQYGTGISSRNSEVVHAGIYYIPESLKARLCVEGRRRLYDLADQGCFPVKKRGKLIFAKSPDEAVELERLYENALQNNVEDLSLLTAEQVLAKEPDCSNIIAALYSPVTGVTNAHDVMDYFYHKASENGADVVCGLSIKSISKNENGYILVIEDTSGEVLELQTACLINAAGLQSDTIAQMIGINCIREEYCLHYCKGDYFRVHGGAKKNLRHLMYPVPSAKHEGLGIHTTIDLAGELRLGPDVTYIDRKDVTYDVDERKDKDFHAAVTDFLPFIAYDDLAPDFAGIRPKLQKEGGEIRDFVISEESDKGFPGLINLIGIESPGLTASPAIASYVKTLVMNL